MSPLDPSQARAVFRRTSKALADLIKHPNADTVHHFRTSTRRMQAVVELLGPAKSKDLEWLDRHLSKIRRRAGRVRDLDVQMDDLRNLQIGRDGDRKQILLDAMEDRRKQEEKKLVRALDKADVKAIRRHLNYSSTHFAVRGRSSAAERALRAFARLARACTPDSEASLHEFRKQAKKVRYLAELGDDATAKNVAAQLQILQDSIGEWHDWAVLTSLAEKILHPESECALLAALRNITGAKLTTAWEVAAESRRILLRMPRQPRRAPARPRRRPPQPDRSESSLAARTGSNG